MNEKLIKISELSIKLNLINPINNKPQNHVIRYWEKEFKQIRPLIINKHRYYSPKQIEIFKLIKFLLKSKGLTINGVKKLLNSNIKNLDDHNALSLKASYYKNNFKEKSSNILKKIKKLKRYGKKNTY